MFDLRPSLFSLLVVGFCWEIFCFKISANLLMTFNLLSPMDANGDVGAGLEIASIRSGSISVSYY